MDITQLKHIAIEAVLAAGAIINKYNHDEIKIEKKIEPTSYAAQVITEVDKKCEKAILDHLRSSCEVYDLGILSEETIDDGGRFEKDYFWCIDPLDGTLAYIQNYPGFSVSIALVAKDGTPHIGVVYDPSKEILYHASKNQGVFKNDIPWKIKCKNTYLTYVTDKKLSATPQAAKIKNLLRRKADELALTDIKEIHGGGAVINAIRVLENGPACMLKLPKKEKGGGSIWDFAATACIFQELGLPASNYAGGKLDLNRKENAFMNHEGVYYRNFNLKG